MSNKPYTVYVDDNYHFMDESERYMEGEYKSYEEAVAACKSIVDSDLAGRYISGMSAGDLYDNYKAFGIEPFVLPNPEFSGFSSWEYAKAKSIKICGMN